MRLFLFSTSFFYFLKNYLGYLRIFYISIFFFTCLFYLPWDVMYVGNIRQVRGLGTSGLSHLAGSKWSLYFWLRTTMRWIDVVVIFLIVNYYAVDRRGRYLFDWKLLCDGSTWSLSFWLRTTMRRTARMRLEVVGLQVPLEKLILSISRSTRFGIFTIT